ncbi:MAG TPA: cupin domain-containing protein [Phenylobacterium sp.]
MKKIDVAAVPVRRGSQYPSPFDEPCRNRMRQALGDAAGLDQFGVNLLTLEPGAWSSQRHWHTAEDEFVYVLEGEVVLVTDDGEETLRPGDSAGFRAGDPNGHHLINRTDAPARILEVGTRTPPGVDGAVYSDIDMIFPKDADGYQHRDGTPYPPQG